MPGRETPPAQRHRQRPHVLVVGAGFGGLEAVRRLSRADVEITLVDRTNHHLFQPLLYQVATAGLSAPAVSAPIRHVLRREMARGNLTVLKAEALDVDVVGRHIVVDGGARLPFDQLIVAAGATTSYFGHPEWERHAPGLKTLADAFEIRSRMIGAFERAERASGDAERDAWLTFAVIGAGPTGVEMAGTVTEIARHTLLREFRRIEPERTRVVLLEGSDRVLGAFVPKLSARAAEQLGRLGVEVRTGCRVTGIDELGVDFTTGAADGGTAGTAAHRLSCRTVIWAAGVAGVPVGARLAERTDAVCDRAGRLAVEPDLSLAGHPDIYVVGDLAAATTAGAAGPTPVPGISPAAKQMGRTAAANILRRHRGEPTQAFRYADYGNLATIGRKAAIVELALPGFGPLRFSGFSAWLFWLFAHIYFLIGFRNRLMVLIDWGWSYFTYARNARVVAEPASRHEPTRQS